MKPKSKKDTANTVAPMAEDLTLLSPEAAALAETWLTASRAAKAAARIRDNFKAAMLDLVKEHKVIKLPGAVIRLSKSVSYDYPAEIEALDELSKALKKEAKKVGAAAMEAEETVEVDDFQEFTDPPATAQPEVLQRLKGWLCGIFKKGEPAAETTSD